jgi:hypothetical protein
MPGTATIQIETYGTENKGTNFSYVPTNINPYVVIGVLQRLIDQIKDEMLKGEVSVKKNV